MTVVIFTTFSSGEFGVVYKAHLFDYGDKNHMTIVAVKTLPGLININDTFTIRLFQATLLL